MLKRRCVRMLLLGLLAIMSTSMAGVPETEATFSVQQLQEDFAFMKKSIARVHPGLSYSADMQQLDAAYQAAQQQLQTPLTRDQAWRALAKLNPVFSDGHMQISMGDFEVEAAAHLKAGGAFFPFEVQVDGAGDVFIRAEMGGAATPLAARRIESINGRPARDVTAALLALTPGDTPALRANLLSGRWWRYYWKAFGTPGRFTLTVMGRQGPVRVERAAAPRLPYASSVEADFDQAYRFEMLSPKVALLSVGTFLWPDKTSFYALTAKMFARLRAAGASTLIIDVRDNTGGDDDMWKEGLLRYIADQPYQHAARFRKMVIEGRSSATEKVGDVVEGALQSWEQPEPGNPLHFSGKTYVVVGRTTYSSAILFSNTMQDFKFATIVGEDGYARARQSGGIQHLVLPNTKIGLIVPRFILDRPSGARSPELIRPDIVLRDDPFNGRAIIDALHARIVREK
jgi:hypothetical protein